MSGRVGTGIVWLRRDLRLDDHAAVAAAAEQCERIVCVFILDPVLLRGPRVGAPIVQSFFDALTELRSALRDLGSDLALLEGDPASELTALAQRLEARAVFFNRDYDPAAIERDAAVTRELSARGIAVADFLDHVYHGADEVTQEGGKPYTVFTPYRRRWMARALGELRSPYRSAVLVRERCAPASAIGATREVPRPEDYGHAASAAFPRGGMHEAQRLFDAFLAAPAADYERDRNIPAIEGTSRLSPHLRAGTIGIRACVSGVLQLRAQPAQTTGADTWLAELIWRDFYQQLLVHHPRVATEPFVPAAKAIAYRDDEAAFTAWCEGRTGYPIVDAAMRQLKTTGWMHNRLRMIVASFLTKHLLIDYRHGERYFEQHLADADLGANNGGWQWSASTGTDAAPYFRVFNPTLQGQTFDPTGAFVRRMIPELAGVPVKYIHAPWTLPPLLAADAGLDLGTTYPRPIVDHATARVRAIEEYAKALKR